jgi:hypothetical protein
MKWTSKNRPITLADEHDDDETDDRTETTILNGGDDSDQEDHISDSDYKYIIQYCHLE